MIRKGDLVFMLKPNKEQHNKIIVGTPGKVLAFRNDEDGLKYLVKFNGHAFPRHCCEYEIVGKDK